jgi:hypothetical protein
MCRYDTLHTVMSGAVLLSDMVDNSFSALESGKMGFLQYAIILTNKCTLSGHLILLGYLYLYSRSAGIRLSNELKRVMAIWRRTLVRG